MASKGARTRLGARHEVVELATDRVETQDVQLIPLSSIRVDGGTQNRAEIRDALVEEYREIMESDKGFDRFPPVKLTYDGQHYWLTDGFHRVEAARRSEVIVFIPAEVTPGTLKDAVLRSLSANAEHGLRRSNADKRRAVVRMLSDQEYGWQDYADQLIAQYCAVTPRFVGSVRDEMVKMGRIARTDVRVGADGRTTNVARIGRQQSDEGELRPAAFPDVPRPTYRAPEPEVFVPRPPQPPPLRSAMRLYESDAADMNDLPPLPKEMVTVRMERALAIRLHDAVTKRALRLFLTTQESDDLLGILTEVLLMKGE